VGGILGQASTLQPPKRDLLGPLGSQSALPTTHPTALESTPPTHGPKGKGWGAISLARTERSEVKRVGVGVVQGMGRGGAQKTLSGIPLPVVLQSRAHTHLSPGCLQLHLPTGLRPHTRHPHLKWEGQEVRVAGAKAKVTLRQQLPRNEAFPLGRALQIPTP
jgi:hypothetical protein